MTQHPEFIDASACFNSSIQKTFRESSVLFVKDIFPDSLLKSVYREFIREESCIISKWQHDKTRLVAERDSKGSHFIKYFEVPHVDNRWLYGQFISSRVNELAKFLLKTDVFLFSLEIHSRFSGCSAIPLHQDNAYYGLKTGSALTFYTALNYQDGDNGGLMYLKNSSESEDLHHQPSSLPGFSLAVKPGEVGSKRELILPTYERGYTSIHHSRSLHYANRVPETSSRSIVVRLSLIGCEPRFKAGHAEWYDSMIGQNRGL